jgi:unsaturated rhamnogalacturonyl hydrolase
MENIDIRNVSIGRVRVSALSFELDYEEGAKGPHVPVLRNVNIENINAESCGQVLYLGGIPGAVIENLRIANSRFRSVQKPDVVRNTTPPTLENVTVEMAKPAKGN